MTTPTGPTTAAAFEPIAPPPWRQWFAELWWVLGYADALLLLAVWTSVRGVRSIPMQVRMPLFAVAVAGFCGVRAVLAYLADPRPLAAMLVAPAVVGLLGLLFCAWVMSALHPSAHGHGGRGATVHHGHSASEREAAAHEGRGHAAVARYIRARVEWAWINASGYGQTMVHDQHKTPAQRIAVSLAGGMATGRSRWSHQCSGDRAHVEGVLAGVPRSKHGSTMAEARRICRAGINAESAYGKQIEQKLLETGRA